ncbi:MAG: PAS domain-containing protein [Candidatus Paceibacterota bacterium]
MVDKNKKIKQLNEDIALLQTYVKDMRDLFSFIPFPVCFANPQSIIMEVNPAFMEITGYKEEKIIGEKLLNFFAEEEIEDFQNNLVKNSVKNWETLLKGKEGEKIPISAFLRHNDEKDDAFLGGLFFSFFDLREIKEKERKLKQKIKEVEKINHFMEGREIKMMELKKRVKELENKLAEMEKDQDKNK